MDVNRVVYLLFVVGFLVIIAIDEVLYLKLVITVHVLVLLFFLLNVCPVR